MLCYSKDNERGCQQPEQQMDAWESSDKKKGRKVWKLKCKAKNLSGTRKNVKDIYA